MPESDEHRSMDERRGGHARSKARLANGVASACLLCFFAVHGVLGSLSAHTSIPHGLAWLAWAGAALVVVHIVACVVTSAEQLTDTVRPPSARKKRHLLLKWASGCIVVACLCMHLLLAVVPDAPAGARPIVTACLAAAVAVHVCYGAKSLLKDLELARRWRMPLRIVFCALSALFALAMLLG